MRSVKRFSVATWSTLSFLLLLGTLFASTANAQLVDQITSPGTVCGGDLTSYGNCTAGEISVSSVSGTVWDDPWETNKTCVRGETITALTTTVTYSIKTQNRYDLLMWIGEQEGTDPRSAVAGDAAKSCVVMSLPGPFPGGTGNDVFKDIETTDQCADINGSAAATNETRDFTNIDFECQDNDNDGKADIQLLLTWSQNQNQSCGTGTGQSFPTNGANSKCDYEIVNSALDIVEPASLTLIKNTLGGDGDFNFNFQMTSGTGLPASTLVITSGGTGQLLFDELTPITDLDITELIKVGWEITDISCTGATDNGTYDFNTAPQFITGIQIAAGEDVVCTVSNTKLSTLTVVKTTAGGNGIFDFDSNKTNIGSFQIDTTTLNTGQRVFTLLEPGLDYTITETIPASGWNLSSYVCVTEGGLSTGTDDQAGTGLSGIVLLPGENTTCTFSNIADGVSAISKVTEGGDGTFDFITSIPPGPGFSITTTNGTGGISTGTIAPGTYHVTEHSAPNSPWTLVDIDCTGTAGWTSSLPTRTVELVVGAGETFDCQFTNVKDGSLTISKTTLPTGSPQNFTFTGSTGGSLSDGQTYSESGAPGSVFTATETALPDWELTDISCTNVTLSQVAITGAVGGTDGIFEPGDDTVTVTVEAGEDVECEFTNTQKANLTIIKHVTALTTTNPVVLDFDFTSDVPNFATFTLSPTDPGTDDQIVFINLTPGVYGVGENPPGADGWALTGASCGDGSSVTAIDLSPGENLACTFTNSPLGSATVIKNTVGGDDTFAFVGDDPILGFNLDTTVTPGTASIDFTNILPAGTYDVVESAPPTGWALTDVGCVDDSTNNSSGDLGTATATINVDLAETVTCTFENTADGTLIIRKQTVPDQSVAGFDFVGTVPELTAPLQDYDIAGAELSVTGQPGVYGTTETVPSFWALTDISCTGATNSIVSIGGTAGFVDGDTDVSVDVAAGETVICTYTNTKEGSLTIVKDTVGGDGQFSFSHTVPNVATPFVIDTAVLDNKLISDTLLPGSYTTTETVPTGWDLTDIACTGATDSTITIGAAGGFDTGDTSAKVDLLSGEDIVCTFTNTERGTITLVKNLPNDDGGDAVETDFTAYIDGNPVAWGIAQELVPGAYTASEDTLTGYAASDWFNACAADGTVTLGAGEDLTCEITNDDIAPTLTLVKTVTNDDGGLLTQTDFPSFVNGVAQAWDVVAPHAANVVLTASETPQTGYTPSVWGGDCAADGTITLLPGDVKTCTITNDDVAPGLTLVKSVTNDNGGTAAITDWTLSAAGPTPISGVSGSQTVTGAPVDAGDYTLSESGGPAGYTAGDWSCVGGSLTGSVVTISSGETAVCTINNDDDTAVLTLVKTITNDDEGTAVETDWTLNAAGPTPITGVTATPAVTAVDVDAGVYTLSETNGPTGYVAGAWSCIGGSLVVDQLTLANGETATCTINNDDEPAAINLAKTVNGPATLEADGTYTVVYTIVASNGGNGPGSYDLVDAFSPGAGITLNTATAVYVPGTETTQTGTLGAYPNFVTSEGLAEMLNESWTVTANFTVDPALTTPETSACATSGSAINTGFYNLVTGSTTDTDLTDNDACTDLPQPGINLAKTVDGPATLEADGTYTVVYTIAATNTGQGPGVYDLFDTFSPGAGITLTAGTPPTAVYVAGTESDQSGTLGAYQDFVTDEALAAGMDESWTVTANFTVDPALTTPETSACATSGSAINTGFYNLVTGSTTDTDLTDNDACTDLPQPGINLAKTVDGPAVRQPGGTYTVVYTITATNTGEGPGVYDLIDAFTPGVGITLDTADAVYLAGTEDDQSGTLGAYPNFVTGEALAAGMDESWTVTAIFSIDLALVTAEGNDCDDSNAGGENTGFTNGVTGSSTDTDLTDNIACTEFIPPAISLDKTADVATYDAVGDVINYDYLITNLGPDVLDPGLSSVVDDKETVTCPAAAPMLVGGTVTCTASHVITQADLTAGLLTNVATAMVDDVTSNEDTVTVTATILPPLDPVIAVPVNDKLALLLLTLMLLLTGWYCRPVAMRKF